MAVGPTTSGPVHDFIQPLVSRIRDHQVVCLADYDKGTLSTSVLQTVIGEARRCGIPCLVDPKKADFSVYAVATGLAPNVGEVERAVGRSLASVETLSAVAMELKDRLHLDWMLITRGAEGMTLAGSEGIQHFPAEVREVADVVGAGDTVVATLAACLATGWGMADACRLATVAAGIAVTKPGVYVVKSAELERAWGSGSTKVLDWDTARSRLEELRRAGHKVVFTNGCFDILHSGHLYCLEQARRLGNVLVVGLNTDKSVKLSVLRGRSSQRARAALPGGIGVRGLGCAVRMNLRRSC